MIPRVFGVFFIILSIQTVESKIFERCELARELKHTHGLSNHDAAMFTCIAERQSNLDSRALGSSWGTQFHGLFQLSDEYWCNSGASNGWVCGVTCDKFRDDDIGDDFTCARYSVYEEHQRLSGDGFNAWPSNGYCKANIYEYLSCLNGDTSNFITGSTRQPTTTTKKLVYSRQKINQGRAKIYDNCDLAQDLAYKHDIPMEQVATWVCIAYHESRYNTSAIGHLNWDGSGDHGLFQISDLYWCGPGKACGLSCEDLHDDDISDDVRCIKQIHAEHTRLSGDGFTAWSVYPRCRGDVSSYIDGCFSEDQNSVVPTARPIRPRPAITAPPRPIYRTRTSTGKVYSKCELAKELYYKHEIPWSQIPTWICIAKEESGFNTSAIGRLNWDGSEDHGLFQISDIYWCSHGFSGKACGLSCEDLRDDDITDDVRCIKQIHAEHTRLSGDGFNAWTTYPRCRGDLSSYVDKCFDNEEKTTSAPIRPRPAITAPTRKTTTRTTTTKRPTTTRRPSVTTKKPSVRPNPNRIQDTTTKKSLFNFYLNDFGKNSKTLPTFKPLIFQSRFKSTEKKTVTTKKPTFIQKSNTKNRFNTPQSPNEIQQTAESDNKPKNAYEYYVKYVLGGRPVTVAPFDFNYIRSLTKPTLRGF